MWCKEGHYQEEGAGRVSILEEIESKIHCAVRVVEGFVEMPRTRRPVVMHNTTPVVASTVGSFAFEQLLIVALPSVDDHMLEAVAFPRWVLVHTPPDKEGLIACLSKHTRESRRSISLHSIPVADHTVCRRELTGEKRPSGRNTTRRGAITPGEPYALASYRVHIRRQKDRMTLYAEAVTPLLVCYY